MSLSKFLKETGNNKESSQRLSLFGALIGTLYLISTVGFYIISRSFSDSGINETEWTGMGIFVGLLLGGLGINAGVKAYQKKFEDGKDSQSV
jgi:hypothetical protein